MKVSFVITVYNVAKYLHQCVRSILQQSYQNIEVILVDDGSKDESPEICDVFKNIDNRIRVIHKENGGLSDARNAGLLQAIGDYIIFVDGDDFWISTDSLRKLVDLANKDTDLDFIGFNCNYYYPDSNKMTAWVLYEEDLANPTDKDKVTTALVKSGTFPMSACLKMMKRSFLIDNGLFFKKGQIAEDIPWFINVLDATRRCRFVNEYVYAYRQNVVGSISNSNNRRSFNSLFDIFKTELNIIDNRSFSNDARRALKSFLAYEYCILLTYKGIDKETRRELHEYKEILSYDLNPKIKKAKKIYNIYGIKATEMALSIYQRIRRNRR